MHFSLSCVSLSSKWFHGIKCFQSRLKTQACFNLVMNGFWCRMSGGLTTYHVCEVLGRCLDAARLPIDHFFYYRSKDKSSFTTPLSVRAKNVSYLTFIYGARALVQGWSPQRQNVGCWNFSRSTTNIISASLATSSLPLAVWNTIWVGPSLRSLRLNKKATRVRQSTQLLLTRFEILLAREGGCSITIRSN